MPHASGLLKHGGHVDVAISPLKGLPGDKAVIFTCWMEPAGQGGSKPQSPQLPAAACGGEKETSQQLNPCCCLSWLLRALPRKGSQPSRNPSSQAQGCTGGPDPLSAHHKCFYLQLNQGELITPRSQIRRLQEFVNAMSNAPIELHVPLDDGGIAIPHQNLPLKEEESNL